MGQNLTWVQKLKYRFIILLPGMRIIKTTIAVLIVALIFTLTDVWSPLYAVLAVIVCTETDMESSWDKSLARLKGTAFAGFYAFLILRLLEVLGVEVNSILFIVIVVILLMPLMRILVALQSQSSVSIAGIVYSVICFGVHRNNPLDYAISRTLTTMSGIIVALLVNSLSILNFWGEKLNEAKGVASKKLCLKKFEKECE